MVEFDQPNLIVLDYLVIVGNIILIYSNRFEPVAIVAVKLSIVTETYWNGPSEVVKQPAKPAI
jgi:hypothetical protein